MDNNIFHNNNINYNNKKQQKHNRKQRLLFYPNNKLLSKHGISTHVLQLKKSIFRFYNKHNNTNKHILPINRKQKNRQKKLLHINTILHIHNILIHSKFKHMDYEFLKEFKISKNLFSKGAENSINSFLIG